MFSTRWLHAAAAASLVFAGSAWGQAAQSGGAAYEPQVGQSGKDVVWVPTPQSLVDKMLDIAKVTASDYVIDLGSGDGRTVITAARRGARAQGIEYNPDMVELSKRNAEKAGVTARASFAKQDLFEADFSQATVITMFLLPDINLKLRPKILDLKPGTRIVSNSFTMGEWQEDQKAVATSAEGCTSYCTALLWIVPAKVEGTWKSSKGELALKQSFQTFTGSLRSGGATHQVANGRLSGDQISFTAGGVKYSGKVQGGSIEGTAGTEKWTATR